MRLEIKIKWYFNCCLICFGYFNFINIDKLFKRVYSKTILGESYSLKGKQLNQIIQIFLYRCFNFNNSITIIMNIIGSIILVDKIFVNRNSYIANYKVLSFITYIKIRQTGSVLAIKNPCFFIIINLFVVYYSSSFKSSLYWWIFN